MAVSTASRANGRRQRRRQLGCQHPKRFFIRERRRRIVLHPLPARKRGTSEQVPRGRGAGFPGCPAEARRLGTCAAEAGFRSLRGRIPAPFRVGAPAPLCARVTRSPAQQMVDPLCKPDDKAARAAWRLGTCAVERAGARRTFASAGLTRACGVASPQAGPLLHPPARRPESRAPSGFARKMPICVVALLGIVVPATTFVARLASEHFSCKRGSRRTSSEVP